MNLYLQGERPLHVTVIGPRDRILVRHLLPDDGIVTGDDAHRDGIYDVYADFRYREWHRVHSPGGRPPGKTRSPHLEHPEQLMPRIVQLTVPDGGPGLYRVTVIASWDHWVSLTPSRPLPTGVHPGPGPLSVHGDRFAAGAYLWVPTTTEHLGVSLAQELAPFDGTLTLRDAAGQTVAQRSARTLQTYVVDETPSPESVYQISVTDVPPGAGLHIRGVPPVLCPDAETARLLHGGIQIDAQGRHTFHHHQRLFDRWADALPAADRKDSSIAAVLAGIEDLRRLAPFYWYDTRDVSYRYRFDAQSPFTAPLRSGWYSLGLDSRGALALRPHMESGAIPDSVVAAWKTSLTLWTSGHWLMHSGETANQWTYNLRQLLQILRITADPALRAMMARDVERLTTVGSLGRLNPDGDEHFIDLGRTPAGYMAEQQGFDGQYGVEQSHNLALVYAEIPSPSILDWWQDLTWLKTHLTLPRHGVHTENPFDETVSPTDLNFRTRYYTHKTGLPESVRDQVIFGDLWRPVPGTPPRRPWPALEDTSFVRSVDSIFHFLKTPRYYVVLYSGPRLPAWNLFSQPIVEPGDGRDGAIGTREQISHDPIFHVYVRMPRIIGSTS